MDHDLVRIVDAAENALRRRLLARPRLVLVEHGPPALVVAGLNAGEDVGHRPTLTRAIDAELRNGSEPIQRPLLTRNCEMALSQFSGRVLSMDPRRASGRARRRSGARPPRGRGTCLRSSRPLPGMRTGRQPIR